MGTRRTWRGAARAAAALVVTFGLAAPAAAETATVRDAKKDVEYVVGKKAKVTYKGGGLDVYRTRIRYAHGALVVRTRFQNLTRCNTEVLARCSPWIPAQYLFVDTTPDPDDAISQEEYRAFYLDHHHGLSGPHGERKCPGLRWRSNLQREPSTSVVPRQCLRRGDRHRVRVMLIAQKTGTNYLKAQTTDLVTDGFTWTHWIRYC